MGQKVSLQFYTYICILQGSVATQLRCSGMFNNTLLQKNFEYRSLFAEDMDSLLA